MSALAPFPAFPAIDRLVLVGEIEQNLIRLCRSIDSFEPISAVVGQAGVGKTLLGKLLNQQYHDTHRVITINDGSEDGATTILQHLVHTFGKSTEGRTRTALRLELLDCLRQMEEIRSHVLLIIDNAQNLDAEAFEGIQYLADLMINDRPRIQCVLMGTQKLEDNLIGQGSESLTQRITTRCYLHPLNENETRDYVHATISQCGADPEGTIDDAAIKSLFHSTSGIPRLINQLMTETIDQAAESAEEMITERIVQSAWAHLQQLPDPNESPASDSATGDIEFGELSDFSDDTSAMEFSHSSNPEVITSDDSIEITGLQSANAGEVTQSSAQTNEPQSTETLLEKCDPTIATNPLDNTELAVEDTCSTGSPFSSTFRSDDQQLNTIDPANAAELNCLESIIEEQLGVSEATQPPIATTNQSDAVFFETDPSREEVGSLVNEEFGDELIDDSDFELDPEAERRALMSLLKNEQEHHQVEVDSDHHRGPVLDIDAVSRNESGLPKQRPVRAQSSEMESSNPEEDYLMVDPPHAGPTSSPVNADEVEAFLRKLRDARGN